MEVPEEDAHVMAAAHRDEGVLCPRRRKWFPGPLTAPPHAANSYGFAGGKGMIINVGLWRGSGGIESMATGAAVMAAS